MIFVFDAKAGSDELVIKGETFKYLVKVRRHVSGDRIDFRNPAQCEILHTYEIVSLDGRQLRLRLVTSEEREVKAKRSFHIGWCVVDAKSVEKVLPSLNELGVEKITFVYAERSQKNFRPDFKRLERIVQNSMQQCGRTQMMAFDLVDNVEAFVDKYPGCAVFDFAPRAFEGGEEMATALIGPEGGFSDRERETLKEQRVLRLDTPMVLRSETAAVAISTLALL